MMSSNKCSCCAVGKPFGFLVGYISALRQYRTLGGFAVGKLLIGRAVATVKLGVENHTLLDGYTGGELDKHFFCMSKDHCRLNGVQFPYDHGKYKTLMKYFCSAGENNFSCCPLYVRHGDVVSCHEVTGLQAGQMTRCFTGSSC